MSLVLPHNRAAIMPGWVKNELWRRARAVPSLDLRFAENKSLVDATTGQNLVTFSRASGATYVDSQGVIRNAVTNLLIFSEDQSNAAWLKIGTTVSSNSVAAPTGVITADTLVEDTSTGTHRSVASATILASTVYTASIYAKAAGGTHLRFNLGSGLAGEVIANLSNGTIASSSGATNPAVQAVGDGWYRISFTAAASTGTTGQVTAQLVQGTSTTSYTGDGTSGIYIWGAQLEQSSTVGEYVPTTSTINSAPRFDHDPTTGESLGLLVEESRTNLLLRSEEFDNASWVNSAAVTANTTASPSGAISADTLAFANPGQWLYQDITISSGATISFSVYAKSNATDIALLRLGSTDGTTYRNVWFNVSSGTVLTGSGAGAGVSTVVGSISRVSNGFFRVSGVFTTSGLTTIRAQIANVDSDGGFTRSGSIYLWGAQLEAGSGPPTSYIPTTASAATRAPDVAIISGSNYSSWANNSEGTLLSDSSIIASQVKTQAVWELSGGAVLSSLRQPQTTANQFRAVIGGTFTGAPGTGAGLTTGVTLAAVAYAGTSGRLQVGAASADATGSALDATSFSIGSLSGLTQLNGHIKRLTFWPQRLGNEVLQRITQ